MDPKRRRQIEAIFDSVLELAPEARTAHLSEVCAQDTELRAELELLLAAHELSEGALERRPSSLLAGLLGSPIYGDEIGPYRIVRELGHGGMGVIFQAEDPRLSRPVALKLLSPHLGGSEVARRRIVQEARAASALDHPNLCTIHDIGEYRDQIYLVMAYYDGETLDRKIARGPLPVEEAVDYARQIADGLAAAHHAGIVHRDVKPGNVMVTATGRVKLLDFGIAKIAGVDLTGQGESPGTISYMSPEQVRGETAGVRTDLWALGVVLYEMLTGARPFSGETYAAILHAILTWEPPPVSSLRPEVPAALADLISRLLAKDADFRPESAVAVRDSLAAAGVVEGSPVEVMAPRRLQQQIRFCTSPDGAQIAYATSGAGPMLVKTANWLTHLEHDWHSPVWRHWLEEFSRDRTLVRYDERGCGLSERDVDDMSFEAWISDLETVVDVMGQERFPLLGISQGCAVSIAYAARHPDRVTRLVLYGGFAQGRFRRAKNATEAEEAEMVIKVMPLGWGRDNPAFRQFFAQLFLPDGTPEQISWFTELQRVTTTPENAVRLRTTSGHIDVSELARTLRVPTIVLHASGDAAVPFEQGRRLASLIPGARFVPLNSRNHILLETEPAWHRFRQEVREFLEAP